MINELLPFTSSVNLGGIDLTVLLKQERGEKMYIDRQVQVNTATYC